MVAFSWGETADLFPSQTPAGKLKQTLTEILNTNSAPTHPKLKGGSSRLSFLEFFLWPVRTRSGQNLDLEFWTYVRARGCLFVRRGACALLHCIDVCRCACCCRVGDPRYLLEHRCWLHVRLSSKTALPMGASQLQGRAPGGLLESTGRLAWHRCNPSGMTVVPSPHIF